MNEECNIYTIRRGEIVVVQFGNRNYSDARRLVEVEKVGFRFTVKGGQRRAIVREISSGKPKGDKMSIGAGTMIVARVGRVR